LGAADAVREAGGTPLPPAAHAEYRRTLDLLQACLGEAALKAACEAGRALTVEEAVAEALAFDLSDQSGGGDVTASSSPSGLSRLTAREVDVLRLIAHGATNPAIAAVLHISIKTVHTHVSHILAKLACTNRTAAAAVAVRHGIV
jgi:DNA-binding NarL/FixJ family response regulator